MSALFVRNLSAGQILLVDMPDLVQPEEAVLYHHKPDVVENFELAITARDALCHDPSHRPTTKMANEPPKDERLGLSFLLQASDPSHTSMDVTVATEPERISEAPAWNHRAPEATDWISGTVDPRFLLLNLSDMLLDEPQDCQEMGHDFFQFSSTFNTPATSVDTLTSRVASLTGILQDLTLNRPHLKDGLDQSYQNGFFATAHFHNALMIFFRRRYYHKLPIHWPTFDPDKIALHLFLAVILTGTAYLQYLEHSSGSFLTESLLELSEKYIFKELKQLTNQDITPVTSSHMLEICQAAVLMNSLEGSANHIEARRRISSKRIPTLVASLRKSGMIGLKHQSQPLEITWESFIHRETCIRVVSWTFVNDSLMTLFCNNPPTMAVKEMTGHFPCHSELWEADSNIAFQKRAQQDLLRPYPSSYNEAMEGLLAEEWTFSTRESFRRLNTSDLFLLTLDRWNSLWTGAFARISADEKSWLGIARHTPEVAALSRKIVELSGTGEAKSSAYMQCVATYDTAIFHEFVQTYGQEVTAAAKD
ncbi:hypothetical protein FSARC_10527 [Fusarium sarcochroum]|uniref:Xylanolytic transcriptional activator regulatory domain-containing protein n=1 Tax=Fusarium sarcochroum TaxID=1208366 RepID=A0A8H4TM02_9HYPO|nr:hypothetical protein FSARC_10527 [Fusarium sarcochroum]